MHVYVVSAWRWGDNENHSYVVGAYAGLETAVVGAEKECDERGGKYECVIEKFELGGGRRLGIVYRTDKGHL